VLRGLDHPRVRHNRIIRYSGHNPLPTYLSAQSRQSYQQGKV
jgi:hypothetical protein